MAASETDPRSNPPPPEEGGYLSAAELAERLEEEIDRAGRQDTPLSCLLLVVENLDELSDEHGGDLPEQMFSYLARALGRELRRFDRIGRPSSEELLLLLPGADGPRGEMVARRLMERLQAIKLEAQGTRQPLRVSMGLAAWRADVSAQELLSETRAATRGGRGEDAQPDLATATPLQSVSPPALGRPRPS